MRLPAAMLRVLNLIQTSYWFVLIRLIFVYAFLLFTSPIATHALARAGIAGGVEPWTGDEEVET